MRARRVVLVVLGAAALLGGGYLAGGLIRANSLRSLRGSVVTGRDATYGTCHRNDVGRAANNANTYAIYKVDQAELALWRFVVAGAPKKTPGLPLAQGLIGSASQAIHSLTWTALNDCNAATDHPLTYVPPTPVTFASQLPPRSAFHAGPGQ